MERPGILDVLPPCVYAKCIEGYSCQGLVTGQRGVLSGWPAPCQITSETIVLYEKREHLEYGVEDGFCVVRKPVKAVLPEPVCGYFDRIMEGKAESKVLLGPGGTGKTLTLELIAKSAPFNIMEVEAESILGGLVGESEQKLYKILDECEASEPCLMIMDEVDILIESREAKRRSSGTGTAEVTANLVRILLRRLQRWYNEKRRLGIVGASNLSASMIEKPMLRAGRLGEPIYFPIPDKKALMKLAELYGKELSEEEMNRILRLGLPHSNVVEYLKTGRLQKWKPEAFAGFEYASVKHTRVLNLDKRARIVIREPWAIGVKLAAIVSAAELEKPVLFLKNPDALQDLYMLGENMELPVAIPYNAYTAAQATEIFYDYPYTVFYVGKEWDVPYYSLNMETVIRYYGKRLTLTDIAAIYCGEQVKHMRIIARSLVDEVVSCISGVKI